MGKIVKKKRKGRPSKTDPARRGGIGHDSRSAVGTTRSEADLRRSTRRRNLTYIGEFYDDLLDEEEEEEDEDERRREKKKVKLVVKLPHSKETSRGRVNSVSRVDSVSRAVSSSSSEYGDDNKPFKKRRIDGRDDGGDDCVDDLDDDDEVQSIGSEEDKKKSRRNGESKGMDYVPGTPCDSQSGSPLPDSKQLELILDKLQKKDTYGVFAEPVDPEELPDYHDVIEHPMDFGTIRKKLASKKYSNLEQLENDVFLVCSNAMQYNAPETIYFKQARSIQELATKKFQSLRVEIEHAAAELKSEQNIKSNSIVKKPIKKPSYKTIQEPVVSEFSSGATLAAVRDTCTLANTAQAGGCERPSNVDGHVEGNGNSSLTENKQEKAEEQLSGKGFPSKIVKKPFVIDENRRATYNISNQPVVRAESMTTIFEGETKQLLPVGLHADHSYARSLARFAATLGPIPWKVASRKIEQALPVGFKFGRGWVGEYEPLPTPVVMLGNLSEKQPAIKFPAESIKANKTADALKVGHQKHHPMLVTDSHRQKHPSRDLQAGESRKDNKTAEGLRVGEYESPPSSVLMTEDHKKKQPGRDMQTAASRKDDKNVEELKAQQADVQLGLRTMSSSGVTASSQLQGCAKERHFVGPSSQVNPGLFGVTGTKPIVNAMYRQQNQSTMDFMRPENNSSYKIELNRSSSTSGNSNDIVRKQLEHSSEMTTSRLLEMVSRNPSLAQPVTFKQPETDGVVAGGLPNGKAVSSHSDNHQVSSLPYNFVSNQQVRPVTHFSRGNNEQGLSDPVQMMRMLAEKTQNQQKSSNLPTTDPQTARSDPSSRRDESSAAAARAWMTLGAGQFKPTDNSGPSKMQFAASPMYNSPREIPQNVPQYREEASGSGRQLESENRRFPPQIFLPQPAHVSNEQQFQYNRQMVVPQFVMSDLSRLQMQSPWRGLVPHSQPNKKQETLPPDLNISFQSSGSPAGQSSGVMVDSQQPDLALQL